MSSPRTSVVIPLYRSSRFVSSISANIRAMPEHVEILVSDRHLLDDAVEMLSDVFHSDKRVKVLRSSDQLDWVRHADFLLHTAQGTYWQYLPHDDISPPGAVEDLIQALDENPKAVLAYGATLAIDSHGRHLPERDQRPTPQENLNGEFPLDATLDLFWKGYHPGSFKGLVRRDVILRRGAGIRPTPQLAYSERAWLFALNLIGPFVQLPRTTLIKRYVEGSASNGGWTASRVTIRDVTEVMCAYADRLISDPTLRAYALRELRARRDERLSLLRT